MKRDQYGRQQTIVLDWDGTVVHEQWPGMGDWLPGAQDGIRRLLDAGYRVQIHSCRLHSYETDGKTKRNQGDWLAEFGSVKRRLMDAGLETVEICLDDKPPARVYLDDRAVRFEGNWRKAVRDVLRAASK